MKILKVIHGYPPLYSAGSEVYSQLLCSELIKQGCEVIVFTRQENAYKEAYAIEWLIDPNCPKIRICLVNMVHHRDGYRESAVDTIFRQLLQEYRPDIVHIGHLNHLSTSLVIEAWRCKIPIVLTMHDFWLMCPRGQFLQLAHFKGEDLYPLCHSQQDETCARNCYWRSFSCQDDAEDVAYWTQWVHKRMTHIKKEIIPKLDLLIAPSKYLMERALKNLPIASSRIVHLDYGFERERLTKRKRKSGDFFTFGYIGTHKQAKGIVHLIQAFCALKAKEVRLKIWGSPLEPFTSSLKRLIAKMPLDVQQKIEWMGGYQNDRIVEEVFNYLDAIVVPSIWGENSPLVIHEALEAKVPVITGDFGGMKELIQHGINGLLFQHRSTESLTLEMKRLIEEPALLKELPNRGYLQSPDGRIPSIEAHTTHILSYYHFVIKRRSFSDGEKTGSLADHL